MNNLTDLERPDEKLLLAPCWWVDTGASDGGLDGDPHFATRDEALGYHVDLVREGHGMPLSDAGALAVHPAVVRRETYCCTEVICPGCGVGQHANGPFEVCGFDCGWMIPDESVPDDPDQERLFEVMRTDDIADQPAAMLVVFAQNAREALGE